MKTINKRSTTAGFLRLLLAVLVLGATVIGVGTVQAAQVNTDPQPGRIIVEKQVFPSGSDDSFLFFASYSDSFWLADGESNDSGDLNPGVYSVSEHTLGLDVRGYVLASATCDDGSDPSSIDLSAGETVTCTFVNWYGGSIGVQKLVDPADDLSGTTFNFTTNYGSGGFGLKTTEVNHSGPLVPGTYSVSEAVPDGWELTSATCVDQYNGKTHDPANIELGSGEYVFCTFVNHTDTPVYHNEIRVAKNTSGYSTAQEFEFETNYGTFFLSDGEEHVQRDLAPGDYSVGEIVPEGWELDVVLVDGVPNLFDNPVVFTLDKYEKVQLIFVNLPLGKIVVEKETIPAGDPATFEFTSDFDDSFFLSDGESYEATSLRPGTYSVSELTPAGWDLTDATCDDGSDPSSIDVSRGETVTCTFTNTKRGSLTVIKNAVPQDAQDFEFDPSDNLQAASFFLDDDADATLSNTQTFPNLVPGTYSVEEVNVPAGWVLNDATCDDGSDPASIDVGPGESVTCTFTNYKLGSLTVVKDAFPNDAQDFEFDPSDNLQGANFFLDDDADAALPNTQTFSDLVPGTYTVQEINVPAGWDLTNIGVSGALSSQFAIGNDGDFDPGDTTVIVGLAPGENITINYTNIKRGMVSLEKLTNGLPDPDMVWNFTLSGPGLSESDSTPPSLINFKSAYLIPGETYQMCETGIPGGWATHWKGDGGDGGAADTVIPIVAGVNDDPLDPSLGYSRVFDPNYLPPPEEYTNDTRCVNFTVEPGQTKEFSIDNTFPGGEPRTIGFWKNWNTCTGGNQAATAAANGGPDAGWYILDDVLNDPGITIGVLHLDGADCADAVNVLDKRQITGNNKKMASDAAYNLAAQLLAAKLNLSIGAHTCQAAVDAVHAGQSLLASVYFDGSGNYLRPQDGQLYQDANALATTLDLYNNGSLCAP